MSFMKNLYLCLSLGLLTACQITSAPVAPQSSAQPLQRPVVEPAAEPLPEGLQLRIFYPQASFQIQAFSCGEAAFAEVSVMGPGIETPIYADGADTQNMIAVAGCNITAAVSDVPWGQRTLKVKLFDAQRRLLSGSERTHFFVLDSDSMTLEVSAASMVTGAVLDSLQQGSAEEKFLSTQIDSTALQTFVDTLTGKGGTAPNYTFTIHPSLIDTDKVIADLKANGGNINQLDINDPDYVRAASAVAINLSDLLTGTSVTLAVDDEISANQTANADGVVNISNIPPGEWNLRIAGTGYQTTTVPVTIVEGELATVNVSPLPVTPVLDSLSVNQGIVGTEITLTGSQLNSVTNNNVVRFGNTQAIVKGSTATTLTVDVPETANTQNVTISVGNQTSAPQRFAVTPVLTNVTAIATQGGVVALTGTGFDTVLTNNHVRINNVMATVTAATATELTVTVPDAGAAGIKPVNVSLGDQTSGNQTLTLTPVISSMNTGQEHNSKPALIRGQTLTITGTSFDPTLNHNIVRFGSITATPATASGTQLTVVIPDGVDTPGDVAVSVTTNTHDSNSLAGSVPTVDVNLDGGFN